MRCPHCDGRKWHEPIYGIAVCDVCGLTFASPRYLRKLDREERRQKWKIKKLD